MLNTLPNIFKVPAIDRLMLEVISRLPELIELLEVKRLEKLCRDHYACSCLPNANIIVNRLSEYLDEVDI